MIPRALTPGSSCSKNESRPEKDSSGDVPPVELLPFPSLNGWFNPRKEGPDVPELAMPGCEPRATAAAACAGTRDSTASFGNVRDASEPPAVLGAPAGRRGSSELPHIPQKRKFAELFSPHFGQITMTSPDFPSPIV